MKAHLDIDMVAYCHEYDCHIAYRLNEFERSNPQDLIEILKIIEIQINQHIKMKEKNREKCE